MDEFLTSEVITAYSDLILVFPLLYRMIPGVRHMALEVYYYYYSVVCRAMHIGCIKINSI